MKSAGRDARLLRTRLQHALGHGGKLLPERSARTATASLLSQGETRCELDTEAALRRSRLPPPTSPSSALGSSPKQDPTGSTMDVDCVYEANALVDGIGGTALPSSPAETLAAASVNVSPQHVRGLCEENEGVSSSDQDDQTRYGGGNEETANHTKGGCHANGKSGVVDRGRLIAILEAEARINAMANHLGSAETTTFLRSLLLAGRHVGGLSPPSGSCGVTKGTQQSSQFEVVLSKSTMMGQSLSADRMDEIFSTPAILPQTMATAGKLPYLIGESTGHTSRQVGRPVTAGKQNRSQSADDSWLRSSGQADSWNEPGVVGSAASAEMREGRGSGIEQQYNHGRQKRSRGGEEAGRSREGGGRKLEENELRRVGRSGSFAMGQRHHMTAPVSSIKERSSYCSLPKLNTSRLSW